MRKLIFGVALSMNRDWPCCPDAGPGERVGVNAVMGTLGPLGGESSDPEATNYYTSPATAGNGHPNVRVRRARNGHFRFTYSDQTEFVVDANGTEIRARWPESSTFEDSLVYLQGPILGFALRLGGITCLHGSAVAAGGRAIAVVGPAGMGKSTTAAVFARKGLGVLTDDLLALGDGGASFLVQPGLPRVLLWPESVEALWGDAEALPRIVPTWPKRYLDLTGAGYHFCSRPMALGAIYVLGDRVAAGSRPVLEELKGTKALVQLAANSYANHLLDPAIRARELDVLGRLVTNVPVRLLRAPADRVAVSATCEAILADFYSMDRT